MVANCTPVSVDVLAAALPTSVAKPISDTLTQVIIPHRVVIMSCTNQTPEQAVVDLKKGLASIKGNHPSVGTYVTSTRAPELDRAKKFFAHNLPDHSEEFNRLLRYNSTADKYNSATADILKKLGYVPNGTTMLQHMRYCIVLAMVELHANSLTAVPEATVATEVNEFLDRVNKEFESYVQPSVDGRKVASCNGIRKTPFAHSMNLFHGGPARTFAKAFEVFRNVCSDIESALTIFYHDDHEHILSLLETDLRTIEPAFKRQRVNTADVTMPDVTVDSW